MRSWEGKVGSHGILPMERKDGYWHNAVSETIPSLATTVASSTGISFPRAPTGQPSPDLEFQHPGSAAGAAVAIASCTPPCPGTRDLPAGARIPEERIELPGRELLLQSALPGAHRFPSPFLPRAGNEGTNSGNGVGWKRPPGSFHPSEGHLSAGGSKLHPTLGNSRRWESNTGLYYKAFRTTGYWERPHERGSLHISTTALRTDNRNAPGAPCGFHAPIPKWSHVYLGVALALWLL